MKGQETSRLTWEVRDHLELCKFGRSMQSYSEFQRVGQGRSMLLPKPCTMISELLGLIVLFDKATTLPMTNIMKNELKLN